jgi:hypothetical protein
MERLPDQCKCPTTYREKIAKWLNLVKRETQLIVEIHENNYKPKIEFTLYNGKHIVERIVNNYQPMKIDDYNYEIIVQIYPQTKINKILAILYDIKGKPLFRHRDEALIQPPDGFEYHWSLGIGYTKKDTFWEAFYTKLP